MDQCISTRPLGPYKQTPWGPAPLTGETACSSALPSTGLIHIWNPGPWSKRPQNLSLLTSDPALVPGYSVTTTTTKSLQLCPTLCDPIDGSPPSSPIPGILQARTLEWVAISFSNAWKLKWKWSCSNVSDPQRPHGLQPSRLLHPWDFPGKSTGVGCHCLLWATVLPTSKWAKGPRSPAYQWQIPWLTKLVEEWKDKRSKIF